MRFDIRNRPDYASLHFELEQGEQVITEAGAMMGMSAGLDMKSNMTGGLLGAAKRMVTGESLFLNTYTAKSNGQRLDLAPGPPGDLAHVALDHESILVQSGSFHANTPGVEMDSKWNGARGFFSGEGLFLIKASGTGDLFLSSYGSIQVIEVDGTYTLDTSHIVAFDESLTYSIGKMGGMKSLFLSGEGLVCHFSGRGRLWFQTRSAGALASFLHPFRPQKKSD